MTITQIRKKMVQGVGFSAITAILGILVAIWFGVMGWKIFASGVMMALVFTFMAKVAEHEEMSKKRNEQEMSDR